MSKIDLNAIFLPREEAPDDRLHQVFHQLHSLLTILIMLSGDRNNENGMNWSTQEHNLFFLIQQMVEELAYNYSKHIEEIETGTA